MGFFWNKKELPDLPLGIRLGGVAEISNMAFALIEEEILTWPPDGALEIKSIGLFENEDFKFIRAYFNDMGDTDEISFLEVAFDKDNIREIAHVRYFVMDGWLTPDDEDWYQEELPVWLDEEEGLIGAPDFNIESDGENFSFDRVWFDDPDRVQPAVIEEKLYIKSTDSPTAKVTHDSMLYARQADENAFEYVFMTHYNGGPLEEGVMIFTGIDLNEQDLKVY